MNIERISALAASRDGFEFVLLSDVHLSEVVRSPEPSWHVYKHPDAAQDDELAEFFSYIEATRPERFPGTVVVFNGDTWDFDSVLARPAGTLPSLQGLSSTCASSVFKMHELCCAHGRFISALSAFLACGNKAIFVMGNHDRELAFEEVQEVLRSSLAATAPPGQGCAVAASVEFEPWFVYQPGLIYAEHGQQYDTTCAYRDVLAPFCPPDEAMEVEIEASLGSVVSRRLLGGLGTINPFVDDSFLMSMGGYAKMMNSYRTAGRPFARFFLSQQVRVFFELRSLRRRALQADTTSAEKRYQAYADRQRVDEGVLTFIRRLMSPPIHDDAPRLLHELWLDRIVLVGVSLLLLAFGVAQFRQGADLLFLFALIPLAFLTMRSMGRGSLALTERSRWGLVAEQVASQLDVPVIAFGHSHRPERRPLSGGGRYYNLGTWAPFSNAMSERERASLKRARRFLRVRPTSCGRVRVAFERWSQRGP